MKAAIRCASKQNREKKLDETKPKNEKIHIQSTF